MDIGGGPSSNWSALKTCGNKDARGHFRVNFGLALTQETTFAFCPRDYLKQVLDIFIAKKVSLALNQKVEYFYLHLSPGNTMIALKVGNWMACKNLMLQLKTGTQKRENLNKEATKLNLELKYKSDKNLTLQLLFLSLLLLHAPLGVRPENWMWRRFSGFPPADNGKFDRKEQDKFSGPNFHLELHSKDGTW